MAEQGRSAPVSDPAAAAQDATLALRSLVDVQYVRYATAVCWALGLAAVAGWLSALAWGAVALAAGIMRALAEKRAADRGGRYGALFISLATLSNAVWSGAVVIAWRAPHPFGRPMALAMVACSYLVVFSQLRNSPRQAFLLSLPFTAVSLGLAATLWGEPAFWPFVSVAPFMATSLLMHMMISLSSRTTIRRFQADQAKLIEALAHERDRAERANTAKSAFLGVVSHELRTPMNGVLGAVQLLDATPLDPVQQSYVAIVRNSGDTLVGLLNDMLDLNRIEADRMTLERGEVDLVEWLAKAGAMWRSRAAEKSLAYEVELRGAPGRILADEKRLTQILNNLLSNALKFTEIGGVRVRLTGERVGRDRARLALAVTDTGPGVAADAAERLFLPFEQTLEGRNAGGAGLGLAICRRLARLMGGDLTVHCKPGEGATFTLDFEAEVTAWTARTAKSDPVQAARADPIRPLQVLLVEDHPVNRLLVERWLASYGHTAISAEDGAAGLRTAALQVFDLILMDINMPVMDGLQATRALRAAPGPNRETPVAVLSASARPDECDEGLAAGADVYLTKPLDFRALAVVMQQAADGRLRRAAEAEMIPAPT
jgi:signal transduction histidine kinase/AmiR/NasT family two-component response regulator